MWPHELKIARAREHLKELEADISRWVKVDGYAIALEPAPDPPDYVVTAQILRPLDSARLSAVVGDCLQNARAALDHLAFALGDVGAEGVMSNRAAQASGFPIIGDVDSDGFSGRGGDLFSAEAKKRLSTVAPEARAVIERLQPYHKGTLWRNSHLWILNELARYDRHRFMHPIAVRSGFLEVDSAQSRNAKVRDIEVEWGPFYPDWDEYGAVIPTVIARLIAEPANPKSEMHVALTTPLHVSFDADTLPSTVEADSIHDIDLVLRLIVGAVDRAIRSLVRFLPAKSPW